MFFPQACLVGYQNSACEHKGNHSKEILDPTGPRIIRARSKWLRPKEVFQIPVAAEVQLLRRLRRLLHLPEPKLAVPYKGNRETFIGLSIGIFYNN